VNIEASIAEDSRIIKVKTLSMPVQGAGRRPEVDQEAEAAI